MFSTDPQDVSNFIAGLRQLADHIESHPGTPVPRYGTTINVPAPDLEDGGREEIYHMYCCLDATELGTTETGTLVTRRTFGSVTYRAFAMPKESMIPGD